MNQYWDILIATFTVISLIVILVIFVHPLNERQLLVIYIFDFVVVIFLAIDFCIRLRASPRKLRYMISHWYEFPAMLPLALLGVLDTFIVTNNPILSFKLIAFFRLVQLYNLIRYIRGKELFLLSGISAVTIIFGAFGTYIAESQNPHANITNLDNAFWFSIETIATVAYGEYYPVTSIGRVIASLMMFAAIGILWTLVGLVGSRIIAKRIKEAPVGLVGFVT
jgi:voltage-gated potassium channel